MIHALTHVAASLLAILSPAMMPTQGEPVKLLEYKVAGRTDTDGPRPVLLALPPGGQTKQLVEVAERLYWKKEAERLGWTVISPIAPSGQSLSGKNINRVLELVGHIEKTYEVEYGRVHVAGASNGGRSALELALNDPSRFASLSLLPGMQRGLNSKKLKTLEPLPLAMYVGGKDTGWRRPMQAMSDKLTELGHPPSVFRVFEGEGHTPKSLTGEILFHTLESFRVSIALADLHDAASKADGTRYFNHFAADAVFMGKGDGERWTLDEWKNFADPYFSKGNGWTYFARQRKIKVAADGKTASFVEQLDNGSAGETSGTGVLLRTDAGWKITQYNLASEDLEKALVEMIQKQSQLKMKRK